MFLLVFIISGLCFCLGYMLGSVLESRRKKAAETLPTEVDLETVRLGTEARLDAAQAHDFLQTIQGLAATVDTNVGRHTSRVETITDSLSGQRGFESKKVLVAAAQLLEANLQLKDDLKTAKQEIHSQQQELYSYMTEARTDGLTGLANRRAFDQELLRVCAQRKRKGTPVSLLMVDVDHFKRFNDYHGHQTGDEMLRTVAAALTKTMREMDLIARFGGEEFAVILPGTELKDARIAAERLRTAVAECQVHISKAVLRVTVSVGGAELMQNEIAEELVNRADAGLYSAKAAGRNCSFIHDGEQMEPVGGRRPAPTPILVPEPVA